MSNFKFWFVCRYTQSHFKIVGRNSQKFLAVISIFFATVSHHFICIMTEKDEYTSVCREDSTKSYDQQYTFQQPSGHDSWGNVVYERHQQGYLNEQPTGKDASGNWTYG
jgi:hypothetical protein